MEKTRTTVKIAGKEYTISSYDTKAYVQRVADLVNRRLEEIAEVTRMPANQMAVLVAVNSTDELMKAKDEMTRVRRENSELHAEVNRLRELLEVNGISADGE